MNALATATSTTGLVANAVPALLLVMGAPLALWWWTRRSRMGDSRRLRITDKAALGKNLWVAVVEVDDKRILLGAGEHGIGMLTELDSLPEESAIAAPDTNGLPHGPRMGLVHRLQRMTLRTSARPIARPTGETTR